MAPARVNFGSLAAAALLAGRLSAAAGPQGLPSNRATPMSFIQDDGGAVAEAAGRGATMRWSCAARSKFLPGGADGAAGRAWADLVGDLADGLRVPRAKWPSVLERVGEASSVLDDWQAGFMWLDQDGDAAISRYEFETGFALCMEEPFDLGAGAVAAIGAAAFLLTFVGIVVCTKCRDSSDDARDFARHAGELLDDGPADDGTSIYSAGSTRTWSEGRTPPPFLKLGDMGGQSMSRQGSRRPRHIFVNLDLQTDGSPCSSRAPSSPPSPPPSWQGAEPRRRGLGGWFTDMAMLRCAGMRRPALGN